MEFQWNFLADQRIKAPYQLNNNGIGVACENGMSAHGGHQRFS
jgi:hypothetical protein